MQVSMEAVSVFLPQVVIDLSYGEIHFGQSPSRVIRLLTEDAYISLCFSAISISVRVSPHEFN